MSAGMGSAQEDPLNPNKVPTLYGTFNSVCEVV